MRKAAAIQRLLIPRIAGDEVFVCVLSCEGSWAVSLAGAAGRPVDVAASKMGLLISDDLGGAVYRVAYNTSFAAAAATFAPTQINPFQAGPP